MPEHERDPQSRASEFAVWIPGVVIGIVTGVVSDLPVPLPVVVAALLALLYWLWPRLVAVQRRRAMTGAVVGDVPAPDRRRAVGVGGMLGTVAMVAVALNVAAVLVAGVSPAVPLFVTAWLATVMLPLWLVDLADMVRSAMYQVAAVSVGATLAIGGEAIVDEAGRSADLAFWHSGWKVALDDARVVQSAQRPSRVSIPAMFTNLGVETASFESQLVLSSSGRHYTDAAAGQSLPTVPGKQQQAGVISFRVDRAFALDDARLTVGSPDQRQAVVALGGAGETIALRPTRVELTGRVKAGGDKVLDVEGGEIRADSPYAYDEAARGRSLLVLRFSATYTGQAVATIPICSDEWLLDLPDGTARGASSLCPIPQPNPAAGATEPSLEVCFEIGDPTTRQLCVPRRRQRDRRPAVQPAVTQC
jgi:hypothetical protein